MSDSFSRLLQVVAVSIMVVIWLMILHKASVDVSALALKHPGDEFWVALAKYFLRNLGGG